jgi:hemerythrin-like domain-containing protein
MHATDLLVQQHEEVSALLTRVRDASGEERVRLLRRLAELIELHAALEEEHFYPLIRRNGFPEAADESVREHAEVKDVLRQLMACPPEGPEVELLLQRLDLAVGDHVDKEESELIPWAHARIEDDALTAAGAAMRRALEEYRARMLRRQAETRECPVAGGAPGV